MAEQSKKHILGSIGENNFYALVGYNISLFASIDSIVFDIFQLALSAPKRRAAIVYYTIINFSTRLDMVADLMRDAYPNAPELAEWERLAPLIRDKAATRNFLAHNPTSSTIKITGVSRRTPHEQLPSDAQWTPPSPAEEWYAHRAENEVLAGKRKPSKKTLDELFTSANQMLGLRLEILRLLKRLRALEERRAKSSSQSFPEVTD